jgi:hypothetical protein
MTLMLLAIARKWHDHLESDQQVIVEKVLADAALKNWWVEAPN